MKKIPENSLLFIIIFCSIYFGTFISKIEYRQQITELKIELKVKEESINGLQRQIGRQTKRITELTGNGG